MTQPAVNAAACLKLVETTPGTVTVSWTGSTDDVAIGGYEVYRSTDGSFGSFVGLAQSTTFTDTTIAPGVTYTYGVKAVDTSGN
ncbi:MAG: fibronectin type III domain-containing protein [Acidimicrobiales bacterium]